MSLYRKTLLIVVCNAIIFASCRKEKEQVSKATDVGYTAAQSITLADAMYSTAADIVSNLGAAKNYKILPPEAKITFLDSSFTDGNGISFYIDFGSLGSVELKGLKCNDARYRAGRLTCSLTRPFTETGAILYCKELSSFYIGNGKEMFLLEGNIISTRIAPTKIRQSHSLIIDELNMDASPWSAQLDLVDINSGYEYQGIASGKSIINKLNYNLKITEAFEKDINCSNTFVNGLGEVESEDDIIGIDFNPYNDEACDEVIRADLNSYEKIIFLK